MTKYITVPVIAEEGGVGGAVDSVNGQTGVVVLDADDVSDSGTTNKYATLANIGTIATGASAKTTPVDADTMPLNDSAASNALKKVTWANIKATLKTYFDTLYQPVASVLTNTTASFTTALETKLNGIATGATANDTDANLKARANHTGTQTLATISDVTSSAAELNILDGVTADAAEINKLDGLLPTTTELNYVDGVTSAIQTQIDSKAADADVVHDTGNETVAGIKTFSSFPVTPSSAPTTDYQAANKKYVDDSVTAGGGYTDEQAQDAVGGIVADTNTIDITYTDATPELKADVKTASITEAMQVLADNTTNNFSTTKHGYVPKGTNVGSFLKDDGTWAAPSGSGDALTTNPLSQFAATTSLQLKGVLSDETGSGAAVFATSPTLVTPALGTPSALVGTNITGTASGLTAGTVTTNANLTGDVTSSGNATTIAAGKVTNAMLSTSAGEIGAAWQSWTPTLSGRLDDADWTKTSYYIQIGKTVHFKMKLVATAAAPMGGGSTDAIFTLPVTANSNYIGGDQNAVIGGAGMYDAGSAVYTGVVNVSAGDGTKARVRPHIVNATYSTSAPITSIVPFAWTTNDEITLSGTYEAA